MRITAVETIPVRVPLEFRYGEIEAVTGVVVNVRTDQGVDGLGHAITLSDRNFRSLPVLTEELGELLIGEDPRQPERLHRKIVPDNAGGLGNVAAAALDIAVWDLAGQIAGLPLYRL